MNEEKFIKKQLLKNMLLTFVTFSLIFAIFDFIIYNKVNYSIYNSIDKEIEQAVSQTKERGEVVTKSENKFKNSDNNLEETVTNNNNNLPTPKDSENSDKNISPRLIYILRDLDR